MKSLFELFKQDAFIQFEILKMIWFIPAGILLFAIIVFIVQYRKK